MAVRYGSILLRIDIQRNPEFPVQMFRAISSIQRAVKSIIVTSSPRNGIDHDLDNE
jgi:hypothetical protein